MCVPSMVSCSSFGLRMHAQLLRLFVQRPGWGIAVCGSCSVVGLRWLAGVCCVCLWWVPPLVPACLCIPTHRVESRRKCYPQCAAHVHSDLPKIYLKLSKTVQLWLQLHMVALTSLQHNWATTISATLCSHVLHLRMHRYGNPYASGLSLIHI